MVHTTGQKYPYVRDVILNILNSERKIGKNVSTK